MTAAAAPARRNCCPTDWTMLKPIEKTTSMPRNPQSWPRRAAARLRQALGAAQSSISTRVQARAARIAHGISHQIHTYANTATSAVTASAITAVLPMSWVVATGIPIEMPLATPNAR